ncbi:MAG: hypothetical protein QNJ72_25780 [Pleurocapsa sp. MO_226.B13]|nr:hypothetical protein [Pleurocapsa sp. MO_226.B13]
MHDVDVENQELFDWLNKRWSARNKINAAIDEIGLYETIRHLANKVWEIDKDTAILIYRASYKLEKSTK